MNPLDPASEPAVGPNGARARAEMIEHTARFERRLCAVRPGVWCLVGNGLSNQTFVEGPDGLIAIDTGESIEEMTAALAEVRRHTSAPVVAVIYTHFHYVGGTAAAFAERGLEPLDQGGDELPVWGHAGIVENRARAFGEIGPAYALGVIAQFGLFLPAAGPDANAGVGLGRAFHNPEHAPFTDGFVAPTETFDEPTQTRIAGLAVEFTPAPSDADDSITIWFPELGVCVNNLVWPTLFNVFAIRGEEYRDPRVLIDGLDHLIGLGAEHLVATHGPPLSGTDVVRTQATRSRDALQFLWDQTVRGINRGLTLGELTDAVRLPDEYGDSYLQSQHYGLVEHHVRQIHNGLRGWFDGDESVLLQLPLPVRAERLVDGLGGADAVRRDVAGALADGDVRWALELATFLARRPDAEDDDTELLADVLRIVARSTTSANVRNWALTRAREIEGSLDLTAFRAHRFTRRRVAEAPLADTLAILRVTLDPPSAGWTERHVVFDVDGERAGLHVRHGVAVVTDGAGPGATAHLTRDQWVELFAGEGSVADRLGDASVDDGVVEFLDWFDPFRR